MLRRSPPKKDASQRGLAKNNKVIPPHTLDISVKKKQVTSQKRSQHSQQNYHKNLGLRKTLHPPKSTRLKLP